MDKGYTNDDFEPKQWGSYTVKDTFDIDLGMKELGTEKRTLILGGQCNLWTEQIRNGRDSLWLGDEKSWDRTKRRKKAMSELCYALDLVCSPARWESCEEQSSKEGNQA